MMSSSDENHRYQAMLKMVPSSVKHREIIAVWRLRVCILATVTGVAFTLVPQEVRGAENRDKAVIEDLTRSNSAENRRTLKRFPSNLLRGVGGVFSRENVHPLLGGALVTGLGLALDDDLRDRVADENDQVADFANNNFGPVGLGVAVVGLFIGGRHADNPRFRDMTYDLGNAAIVNLSYTALLKAAVSRNRPNATDNDSFPSGHTSNAFVLATVLSEHYGDKLGPSAYIAATLIGASRLRSNAHWLTDVIAGATLGHIVGRSVVRQNNRGLKSESAARRMIAVFPSIGYDVRAVTLTVSF